MTDRAARPSAGPGAHVPDDAAARPAALQAVPPEGAAAQSRGADAGHDRRRDDPVRRRRPRPGRDRAQLAGPALSHPRPDRARPDRRAGGDRREEPRSRGPLALAAVEDRRARRRALARRRQGHRVRHHVRGARPERAAGAGRRPGAQGRCAEDQGSAARRLHPGEPDRRRQRPRAGARARAFHDARRAGLFLLHERGGGGPQARPGRHRAAARGHRGLQVPPRHATRTRPPPSVPFREGLRAAGQSRDAHRRRAVLRLLQRGQRSRRRRAVDAAGDPGRGRPVPAVVGPVLLALPRQAGARGPRAGRGRRRRADRRSLRPHRRGRADADQLPGPAEDLSPLQHQRHPRRQAAGRHVQGQDRAGRRDGDRHRRHPQHAVRARVSRAGDPRHGHRQHPDRGFHRAPALVPDLRPHRHRGPAAAGRGRAAAPVRLRRAAVRRDALRALRRRRLSAVRARLRVAQHGVSGLRPRGDLHDADPLSLSDRRARAPADQGRLPALRVARRDRADAGTSRAGGARRTGARPHGALQRSGRLHQLLGEAIHRPRSSASSASTSKA